MVITSFNIFHENEYELLIFFFFFLVTIRDAMIFFFFFIPAHKMYYDYVKTDDELILLLNLAKILTER